MLLVTALVDIRAEEVTRELRTPGGTEAGGFLGPGEVPGVMSVVSAPGRGPMCPLQHPSGSVRAPTVEGMTL